MIKVTIKLNNNTNITVNMNYSQFKYFRKDIQLFTWLTLNKYTDDLKLEVIINVNNISLFYYKEL